MEAIVVENRRLSSLAHPRVDLNYLYRFNGTQKLCIWQDRFLGECTGLYGGHPLGLLCHITLPEYLG